MSLIIKLSGSEGYYCRELKFEGTQYAGTTIRVRELSDDALGEFLRSVAAAREHMMAKLTAKGAISAEIAERLQSLPTDDVVGLGRLMDEVLDPEEQIGALQAQRAAVNIVCTEGVVSWDIPTEDCTPANVARLPNAVKAIVAQAIIRDTVLTAVEEGNSPRP